MKKLYIFFVLTSIASGMFAQTNTFPSTGNVGIGTISPWMKLSIEGNQPLSWYNPNGTSDKRKYYFNVSSDYFTIAALNDANSWVRNIITFKHDGNLGIGTTSPSQKLSITNGQIYLGQTTANLFESGRIRFTEFDGTSYQGAFIHYNGDANVLNIGVHNVDDALTSNDVNAISILRTNGYVGIGTTTPIAKLDINGGLSISGFNSSSSVNGFHNKLQLIDASNAAIVFNAGQSTEMMFGFHIDGNFYWGTGRSTSNPNYYSMYLNANTGDLGIKGKFTASEVVVKIGGWSDYVFNSNYNLCSLYEVEKFIKENNHLPGIPSESDVIENGIGLGDINAKLLQKVEELTLYMIELKKENEALKKENDLINERLKKLENSH